MIDNTQLQTRYGFLMVLALTQGNRLNSPDLKKKPGAAAKKSSASIREEIRRAKLQSTSNKNFFEKMGSKNF